ncbi:hypothetical protein EVAR_21021_1 [Eumeta japonica]|uniref:Uncharacterized protein n=1 Tax=Eumeta variegata TaxID=151549 RepID=A0A4C1UZS5_EUMVA|nr:hypothetical protein EVAR_21021_1 [Eumeta japonica]
MSVPVAQSSLLSLYSPFCQLTLPAIGTFPHLSNPMQEAADAAVTSLGSRVSMDGGDHLLSDGSSAYLPFAKAIKKMASELSMPRFNCREIPVYTS